MTSNMGSSVIRDNFAKMTDDNREETIEKTKEQVIEMLKQTIRPEVPQPYRRRPSCLPRSTSARSRRLLAFRSSPIKRCLPETV